MRTIEIARALADPGVEAPVWSNLGIALMRSGRPEEALETFRAADAASPGFAEAKLNAANVLRTLGRSAEAVPLYEAALVLDPGLPEARLGLAGALFEVGDPTRGDGVLEDLLRDAPGFTPAHLLRAMRLDGGGRAAEAEAEYLEACRLWSSCRGLSRGDPGGHLRQSSDDRRGRIPARRGG